MKLNELQLHKWNLAAEQLLHGQTKIELKKMECEKLSFQLKLCNNLGEKTVDQYKDIEKDYNELKLELEKELGFSLTNCTIKETGEVIRLEG